MNNITQYLTGWGEYYLEILIAIVIGLAITIWYLSRHAYKGNDGDVHEK